MTDVTGLHPELVALIPHLPDLPLDDPDAAREAGRALVAGAHATAAMLDLTGVERTEVEVPSPDGLVPVTVYRPIGVARSPAVINIHGGGFVMGDRASIERQCLSWVRELGVTVFNPEYGLAPERPCPGAMEDCYAVLEFAAGDHGVCADQLAIAGSSAGACIAAGVTLMARDRSGPALVLQALGCPVLDDRADTESARTFIDTPVWNRDKVLKSWDHYAGTDRAHLGVYGAPARTNDLSGLPPAFVLVAGRDPLRDEGLQYARRLADAGIAVELHHVPDVCHGFTSLPGIRSDEYGRIQIEALRRALTAARDNA